MIINNWPALFRVVEHILDHPEQHDQTSWESVTQCGTTRCIAGWLAHFDGWSATEDNDIWVPEGTVIKADYEMFITDVALDALDVYDQESRQGIDGSLFGPMLDMDEILTTVQELAVDDGVALPPRIQQEITSRGL